MILVLDAWRCDDPVLEVSHWMADRTLEVVPDTLPLFGVAATRAPFETAIRHGDPAGVALFGHGDEASVAGSDRQPVLDVENVRLLAGRWAHAMACRAGVHLAGRAAAEGAACFVGYDVALLVDWKPERLPAELRPLVADLVTVTTRKLADGARDEPTLRRAADAAALRVQQWMNDHPDVDVGRLSVAAHQLVARMVVRAAATSS
ncbi:MAG: hypothetical protein HY744_16460 [Deltaproteobacteria bacterium]|nr:hypothetical protein [Deltaproteobacteria bacterium]